MLKHYLSSKYEAFIFDCDGTIADTMGIYHHIWNLAIRKHGATVEITWEEFRSNGGRCLRETTIEYNRRHGTSMDPDAVIETLEIHTAEWLPRFKPIAPVVELIHAEKQRPMAVASSGKRVNVQYVLQRLSIDNHFHCVLAREDVKHSKPEPDLFLLAAKRMKIAPEKCIVFEDSPLGEEAARHAGMACQRIPYDWWDRELMDSIGEEIRKVK
ncbi:MAG: HAD family phosphatase [Puniceicoccales bacterium]|jgi:HAD superfamily hydrolase (TIGR01509 family)|nr:HAD family phosphatase [Puniceicoccales bacterium]